MITKRKEVSGTLKNLWKLVTPKKPLYLYQDMKQHCKKLSQKLKPSKVKKFQNSFGQITNLLKLNFG
jgi:hypothetical protein